MMDFFPWTTSSWERGRMKFSDLAYMVEKLMSFWWYFL